MGAGVVKGTKRGKYISGNKYTDEYIIEVISKYKTRTELRMSLDSNYYYMVVRRGLKDFLPPKRNTNGDIIQRPLELKNEYLNEEDDKKLIMFPMLIIDGRRICGRCHVVDLGLDCSGNKNLCSLCYSRKNYLISQGKNTNLFNVKDEYVNTIIKHHEKVFEIGLKVDDRMEGYLTRVGYGFIFKDNTI